MGIDDEIGRVVSETIGKVTSEIYADIARPAARQIGVALETLFKVGLSPVTMLDWGFEQSKDWLKNKIEERINTTPKDCLRAPPNNIAIPVITSISMSSDAPELRDLYAELLLKAMDYRTESMVHPSYISIIGQLTPQEALVFVSFQGKNSMKLFQENDSAYSYKEEFTIEGQLVDHCRALGFDEAEQVRLWLENLLRLRLVDLRECSEASYVEPDGDRSYPSVRNREDRYLNLTEYGSAFLKACTPPNAAYAP